MPRLCSIETGHAPSVHSNVKMKKLFHILILILFFADGVYSQDAGYNAIVNKYILQYSDIAVKEMLDYHIPASITLAQGILESNAGRSPLALEAKNHFGIKCHKEWTGMTFYKDDETKNECFRKYNNPLESFKDHSLFLTTRDRYKPLFSLDIIDYKGWANGLKAAGYATNPSYPQLLIKTIETFHLDRFDRPMIAEIPADKVVDPDTLENIALKYRFLFLSKGPGNRNIYENNQLQVIIAQPDDNLYLIARDFNTTVGDLLKFNDLPRATSLKPGQIVYLLQKRRKGAVKNHQVLQGETCYYISQLYGLRIKFLYKRNKLSDGAKLKQGTVLRLR